jgi:branched-chain amino acid transport system ATP-binding protein
VNLLEVEGLDAFYGDFQALFGLTVDVEEGERLAIIGANGAGKSTFLKTVAGLVPSSPGAVRFEGRPIGHLPTHRRVAMGISLVPEGRRLFPDLTVQENLLVGRWGGRPGPWSVQRVFELFPMLEKLSRRPAGLLSGGEQQAVAIGRALMANPRLLLMDEISLGLAPVVVRRLYEAIPRLSEEGITLVLVEQDVTQALRVADRVLCFLEGRVSLGGRPAELSRDRIRAAYFGV